MSESKREACAGVGEHLVAYVDGELAGGEFDAVHEHVATCLPCRRELESIERVGELVAALPRIEPSRELADALERRLGLETGRARPAAWGAAFAAAAAVALALGSVLDLGRMSAPEMSVVDTGTVLEARAPAVPAPARVVPARAVDAVQRDSAYAEVAARDDELMPEDLPPDLLERPELYLRLPVVRRLEKLEHFEAVRSRADPDRVGRGLRSAEVRSWG